jgi:hypothetical protein
MEAGVPTCAADKQIQTLRVAREVIQHLLDTLDQREAAPAKDHEGRRARRTRYRSIHVIVHVLSEYGDTRSRLQVATRNISRSGLSFLHRRVMHVGQDLDIWIPLPQGRTLRVLARVVRCRHVQGMVHEIGVRFTGVRKQR